MFARDSWPDAAIGPWSNAANEEDVRNISKGRTKIGPPLLHVLNVVCYSYRSASAGLIRAAWRLGTQVISNETVIVAIRITEIKT